MDQTFKRKSDLSTILTIDANLPAGQADDDEAPFRYSVHRTLDGNQIELRDNPPVLVGSDRPIEMDVPLISTADLAILRGIRMGTYGLPVVLSNAFIAGSGLDAIVISVESEPHPGFANHQVRIVVQIL